MPGSKFRLRRLAIAIAALAAAQAGISLSLRLHSVHRALRATLERAIGRPVVVSHFAFSLWGGPRLQALYVTVEEDPEFGAEFLLRADRLEVRPEWRALLRGRLVLSRIWLERPSLNLVRGPSGRWNYEDWAVARPPASGGSGPVFSLAARLTELAIRDGRINFKRGPEKLPFALLDVNGSLSAGTDGQWHLALRAQPFHAGVTLQDAGVIELEGILPALKTSREGPAPAAFSAHWQNASLPDALRLLFARDFGVRGRMEASFSLRRTAPAEVFGPGGAPTSVVRAPQAPGAASPAAWSISGALRVAEVHRWDLPPAPALPALNLSVEGAASLDGRRGELSNILLEGPRSNLRGRATFDRDASPQASLRIVTASIQLDDLLAWYRAFHPGVDPKTSLDGYLGADVELEAWPPAVVRAALVTTGARLNLPDKRHSLYLRRAVLEADRGGARLQETSVAFGEDEPGVRFSGKIGGAPDFPFTARVAGATEHLAELSSAIAALGLAPSSPPLRAAGYASVRLNWTGAARPWHATTSGSIALEDVAFSGGFLRAEISLGSARLDFLPGERRLQFAALQAFGGTWNGMVQSSRFAGPWECRLVVDRLAPAQLVRGFSSQPPENSSLLSRILPAQAAATVAREQPPWPVWLRGEGTISAGKMAVGRLEFERLNARLRVDERGVALESAEATLAGGRMRGDARAVFGEEPDYTVHAEFEGVNVASLSALAVSSRECCAGTGSGRLELTAAGWNRDALLASLKGSGSARLRSGVLLTLDLPASLAGGSAVAGRTPLREVASEFTFANGHAWLDHLVLELPAGRVEGKGNVDYQGQLDLRFSPLKSTGRGQPAGVARLQWKGTLVAPQISPATKASP
jgi:hypothetical protein